jgi:hypothetical protein
MRFIPFAAPSAGVVMPGSCTTEAHRAARSAEDVGYRVLGGVYDSANSGLVSYECPNSACD